MGRALQRTKRERSGLLAVLLTAAAMSACPTPGAAQLFARAPARVTSDCYSETYGNRRDTFDSIGDPEGVFSSCASAAGVLTASGAELLYANFWSGKAARVAGANGRWAPSDPRWQQAEERLRRVAEFTPTSRPAATTKNPNADTWLGLTRIEAKLELAQILSARRDPRAEDYAKSSQDEFKTFGSSLAVSPAMAPFRQRANQGRVTAALLSAKLRGYPDTPSPGALDALQVFLEPGQDQRSAAAQDALKYIVSTAESLGDARLEEGSPQSLAYARDWYGKAHDAAEALDAASSTQASRSIVARTLVNLGRVTMAENHLAGPQEPGGCDSGGSHDTLQTAINQFDTALTKSRDSIALQWMGCALLARDDVRGAVRVFKEAAESNANDAPAQLALGRGLYSLAKSRDGALTDWAESRAAYNRAIGVMGRRAPAPSPRRTPAAAATSADLELAKVHVELARVDMDFVDDTRYGASTKTGALQEARNHLATAIGLAPTNSEGLLRLGKIQIDDPGRWGDAETNIRNAIRYASGSNQVESQAEGHYLLSVLYLKKHNAKGAIQEASAAADLSSQGAFTFKDVARYYDNACEVRIFLRQDLGNGETYCRAVQDRDPAAYPAALLRQGKYYLVLGVVGGARRGGRGSAYDDAYSAFEKGLAAVEPVDPSDRVAGQLRANLRMGKGIAMTCSHLEGAGRAVFADVEPEWREGANAEFERLYYCK